MPAKVKVWKHEFPPGTGSLDLLLPRGANFLAIGEQKGIAGGVVVVWFSFRPEMQETKEARRVTLLWTGEEGGVEVVDYIGTCQLSSGIVVHAYEAPISE